MSYERDRDRHRYKDYRHEDNRVRRHSDSPNEDEFRRRDKHYPQARNSSHHYERDYEYPRGRDDRHHRHSRSRSRDKHDEEAKMEETEQKIRLAIRNNTINYELAIHEMYMKLGEGKRAELAEQAQSPQKIHECILVRELYVSGMYDAGDQAIRSFFSKYGEIEDVQIIKNFVFVKYFKVEDASNACADYHNINTTLHQNNHNSNFKIFFADHLKRSNVVSNNPLYEIKDHLIPVLYASVRNDPQYTNEQYLSSIFSRFGYIRNMEVKRNQLPTQRTYVLVEYETLAQALRAREKMKVQREKLGDRKSEITILIDNEKILKIAPNIGNQLKYQRKRQNNTAQMTTNPQQPQLPQHDSFNYTAYPGEQKQDVDNEIDGMMGIIMEHAGNNANYQEEHAADWCGFLTRNKHRRVEVDFYRIHKEPLLLDEQSLLNVAFRGNLSEGIQNGRYSLAGRFRAANAANQEAFQQYIRYFTNKNRAGIVMTTKYLIYLIPPLPELNIPYPVQNDQLLALFYKIP